MKKIVIELRENGGYEIKGMGDIREHADCVWAILAARRLEDAMIEQGYLREISNGIENRLDTSKIQLLAKEAEVGDPVSPTYIQIELPSNVPSKIKPVVILPDVECESVNVKVKQYGKNHASFYSSFEFFADLNESKIINLNTGSVNR